MTDPHAAGLAATDLLRVAHFIEQQATLTAVTEDMPKNVQEDVEKGLSALDVLGRSDKAAVRARSALIDLAAACEDYRSIGTWVNTLDEVRAEWRARTERRVLRCVHRADKALERL